MPETGKDLETKVEEEVVKIKAEVEEAESVEEVKESGPIIPTVKPPISFPSLPKQVEVPDDPEKRADLILEIYEHILLAMSLGAAKIMGVAPAVDSPKDFFPLINVRNSWKMWISRATPPLTLPRSKKILGYSH